jgi:hypothetical protein
MIKWFGGLQMTNPFKPSSKPCSPDSLKQFLSVALVTVGGISGQHPNNACIIAREPCH